MFLLEDEERGRLWDRLVDRIERYILGVARLRVAPPLAREGLRTALAAFDFKAPVPPRQALDFVADQLEQYQVHTPHPRYFGLFNPAPTTVAIAADALVAAFNPQLAAWSHSPFAAEVEEHVVRAIAARFGYDPGMADGVFTTGGAEANHTALLAALCAHFPDFREKGVHALPRKPVFYLSREAHDSLAKASRLCGLGTDAARRVATTADLAMDLHALAAAIESDRATGLAPFLVVGTAGSTGAGVVDPLEAIAETCARQKLWFHADAAYGGAAVLLDRTQGVLRGIDRADSLTFDAHKWFSVPMAAGMFLTRHPRILTETFRVAAGYMPQDAAGMEVTDPFAHSIQWSRRFIGLKVFLSLAVHGWKGYEQVIAHQTAMGDLLRDRLKADGWKIVNDTPLPVVCIVDPTREVSAAFHQELVKRVVSSGSAWISTAVLGGTVTAIRACITNFRTQPQDVEALVAAVNAARHELSETSGADA